MDGPLAEEMKFLDMSVLPDSYYEKFSAAKRLLLTVDSHMVRHFSNVLSPWVKDLIRVSPELGWADSMYLDVTSPEGMPLAGTLVKEYVSIDSSLIDLAQSEVVHSMKEHHQALISRARGHQTR